MRKQIVLLIAILMPAFSLAAPKSEYWDIWDHSDEMSLEKVDHSAWQTILEKYLQQDEDGITKMNYKGLLDNDRAILDEYLSSLTAIDPRKINKKEQLAYWINLYNALTVQVVLDHYPTKSILKINISPGFFTFGPWDKKLIIINDVELSLNDIEHRILRPIWQDPRIHYAVNCASKGCPNLGTRVYSADNAEEMLTQSAIDYVNHPRGVQVLRRGLRLSTIFKWYKRDFGRKDSEVLEHIRQYASEELLSQMSRKGIVGYRYNWDLNEQ